jgi:ferredoxin--NADP+ reductase
VVIGNGNVAIDVARMLVLDLDSWRRPTPPIMRVGPRRRRSATRSCASLASVRADVIVDPGQLEGVVEPEDTTQTRNVEMLREYVQRERSGKSHRIELRFLRSPVEMLGDSQDGRVTGIRVAINRLDTGPDGRVRAVATGEEEIIECGLVLRSIGYRGYLVAGIPFDERRGLIRNIGGRVREQDGAPCPGEYVVGWIKRGPSGVIGTNKKDAADTVARIMEDVEAGALTDSAKPSGDAVDAWLGDRVSGLVTRRGWEAIDGHECSLGQPAGRPRVKLVREAELIEASRATVPR